MPRPWGDPLIVRNVAEEVYGWGVVGLSYMFLMALVLAGAWWELG